MRYGYWLPVFGGWLRNVDDENMDASWDYAKKLAVRSEQIGFDLTLIAELNLNDIKGTDAPCLDAWSTAAALAAVTEKLELMVAVRPTFHNPAILAKQAANIANIRWQTNRCARPNHSAAGSHKGHWLSRMRHASLGQCIRKIKSCADNFPWARQRCQQFYIG